MRNIRLKLCVGKMEKSSGIPNIKMQNEKEIKKKKEVIVKQVKWKWSTKEKKEERNGWVGQSINNICSWLLNVITVSFYCNTCTMHTQYNTIEIVNKALE